MGVWATRRRSVLRACALLGDEVALAKHLGVSVPQVVDWILGLDEVADCVQKPAEQRPAHGQVEG